MKAKEIKDAGVQALKSGKYRNVRLNFANPDMVGPSHERLPVLVHSTRHLILNSREHFASLEMYASVQRCGTSPCRA